ncbi:actin related protein [Striga asiatica]|uniref:Actin related protein n=1 Tax=Striga asiatica TaxID=4170 RepID=A0A5A7R074_STRAF|nr:actin related protein [Striga asiatica]
MVVLGVVKMPPRLSPGSHLLPLARRSSLLSPLARRSSLLSPLAPGLFQPFSQKFKFTKYLKQHRFRIPFHFSRSGAFAVFSTRCTNGGEVGCLTAKGLPGYTKSSVVLSAPTIAPSEVTASIDLVLIAAFPLALFRLIDAAVLPRLPGFTKRSVVLSAAVFVPPEITESPPLLLVGFFLLFTADSGTAAPWVSREVMWHSCQFRSLRSLITSFSVKRVSPDKPPSSNVERRRSIRSIVDIISTITA